MPLWTIEGRVVSGTRNLVGLRVEGRAGQAVVGTATPSADGLFALITTVAEGVSFRVLEGGRTLLDSSGTATWSAALGAVPIVLRLSPPEADRAALAPIASAKAAAEGFVGDRGAGRVPGALRDVP